MAANLNKTKRRISSIKATRKITNAMELVATVKLRKYRANLLASQNYALELKDLISQLINASKEEDILKEYLKDNDAKKELCIVVSSDLGLCASYNADLYKFALSNIDKTNTLIMPIGTKGERYFIKEGYDVDSKLVNFGAHLFYRDLNELSEHLCKAFLEKKYRKISIIATEYINSIRFKPRKIDLLPFDLEILPKKESKDSPLLDDEASLLVSEMIPKYLTSVIYNALVEAFVSEEASRRNAMENATDNADELIDELTLEYNKARQDAITREITEVVSSSVRR